jgi:hypothetical protein
VKVVNQIPQIYEIGWIIGCGEYQFLQSQWHVFTSYQEAEEFGKQEQDLLNGGLSDEDRAVKSGYYYKYWYAKPVTLVDDYSIHVTAKPSTLTHKSAD